MVSGPSKGQLQTTATESEPQTSIPSTCDKKIPGVQATEVTPLFGQTSAISNNHGKGRMSPGTILVLMAIVLLVSQAGDSFIEAPQIRVFESIFCYQYWEKADPSKILIPRSLVGPGALGGVEERYCKVPEVQGKIAMLQGSQQSLDGIPSLILAIPVGILADRIGRKPLLVLGMCSFPLKYLWIQLVCWFWQSFDLRIVWLSSLTALMGGGSTVMSALLFVVLSDVTSPENRSQTFLRLGSMNMLANFIIPPLSAWIMTFSPWLSLFIGLFCCVIGTPILLVMPETLGYNGNTPANVEAENLPRHKRESLLHRCYRPVVESTRYFLEDWRILPLLATFVLIMCTVAIVPLLIQYSSVRYHMTFSNATLLVSIKAGVTIVLFLFVQPWFTHFLTKTGVPRENLDLISARVSAILLFVGWIGVSLAPNAGAFAATLMLATMGNAFPAFIRCFLTDLVDPGKVAELYTIIGLVNTAGLMAGMPLLAWLFERGLKLGGIGIGLPFWCLGLGYGIVSLMLFCIGHQKVKIATSDGPRSEHEAV